MQIKQWIDFAAKSLNAVGIKSSKLDSEIILAHTLKKNRTYLHAYDDEPLDPRSEEIANARLELRLDRVPIAYIIGHKEFYGRQFNVTTATLIPRPESETIIDVLKGLLPKNEVLFDERPKLLVDIGTGSGNLGITAKLELPELDVTLLDISTQALKAAENNARLLRADVQLIKSNLLANYPFRPDIIIANLPYIDPTWKRSQETRYEPESALFAAQGGMFLINKLVVQSQAALPTEGILLLEADPRQHQEIIALATRKDFLSLRTEGYCIVLRKKSGY
jgi:release factor glutamine methyltransferase